MIIAIDGPAASGKGTLGKRIAAHYGLAHLDTGKRAHEGGVHDRTTLEIDHELAVAAVDHLLGKFLQPGAVQEGALPLNTHPHCPVGGPDKDGRLCNHDSSVLLAASRLDAPLKEN